jgi:hypothetical protein
MFNNLLGRGGFGGNEDTLPNIGNGVIFDEADAAGDFENQLRPPPATVTVTQQQADKGASFPSAAPMLGGGATTPTTTPTHTSTSWGRRKRGGTTGPRACGLFRNRLHPPPIGAHDV